MRPDREAASGSDGALDIGGRDASAFMMVCRGIESIGGSEGFRGSPSERGGRRDRSEGAGAADDDSSPDRAP